jgi:hypothetical protein
MRIIEFSLGVMITAAFPMASSAGAPTSNPAQARALFEKKHPRRAEIERRITCQQQVLRWRLKGGTISRRRYSAVMSKLNQIKSEESFDVKANGGHLTDSERWTLGNELDRTHNEIMTGRETVPDSSAPAAGDLKSLFP